MREETVSAASDFSIQHQNVIFWGKLPLPVFEPQYSTIRLFRIYSGFVIQ
jgi:hypothetical protein